MTDGASFAELHRRRGGLDRDVATIIAVADTIAERLRAATGTVAVPNPVDRRARGRKGPTNPTLGAMVSCDDYATTIRTRWHKILVAHDPRRPKPRRPPARPPKVACRQCEILPDIAQVGHLDIECLAGMVHRAGGDVSSLTGREFDDTVDLANRMQDTWYALYQSRQPDPYLLGTVARDLTRVRGRLESVAADLLLWSDDSHPAAGQDPKICRCEGDNCRHAPGQCTRLSEGREKCSSCRSRDSRSSGSRTEGAA